MPNFDRLNHCYAVSWAARCCSSLSFCSDGLPRSHLVPSEAFLAGASAGAVEALLSTPFALLTTRRQLLTAMEPSVPPTAPLLLHGPPQLTRSLFSTPQLPAKGNAPSTQMAASHRRAVHAVHKSALEHNIRVAATGPQPGWLHGGSHSGPLLRGPVAEPLTEIGSARPPRADGVHLGSRTAGTVSAGCSTGAARPFSLSLQQYPWLPVKREPPAGEASANVKCHDSGHPMREIEALMPLH